MINCRYIYKYHYHNLPHQSFRITETSEQIVWIYADKQVFYRCYGLPETLMFCDDLLNQYNKSHSLDKYTNFDLSMKQKLIYSNLINFINNSNSF